MGGLDGVGSLEIGDSLGDFDGFVETSSGEIKPLGGRAEKALGFGLNFKEPDNIGRGEGAVGNAVAAVAAALSEDSFKYFIFYNIVFGMLEGDFGGTR